MSSEIGRLTGERRSYGGERGGNMEDVEDMGKSLRDMENMEDVGQELEGRGDLGGRGARA
jgi:hypothetical protein